MSPGNGSVPNGCRPEDLVEAAQPPNPAAVKAAGWLTEHLALGVSEKSDVWWCAPQSVQYDVGIHPKHRAERIGRAVPGGWGGLHFT